MRTILLFVLLAAGCAGPADPVVDHTGVDEGRLSRDLAWCRNHQPFVALGNPVTTCMAGKGYTILSGG